MDDDVLDLTDPKENAITDVVGDVDLGDDAVIPDDNEQPPLDPNTALMLEKLDTSKGDELLAKHFGKPSTKAPAKANEQAPATGKADTKAEAQVKQPEAAAEPKVAEEGESSEQFDWESHWKELGDVNPAQLPEPLRPVVAYVQNLAARESLRMRREHDSAMVTLNKAKQVYDAVAAKLKESGAPDLDTVKGYVDEQMADLMAERKSLSDGYTALERDMFEMLNPGFDKDPPGVKTIVEKFAKMDEDTLREMFPPVKEGEKDNWVGALTRARQYAFFRTGTTKQQPVAQAPVKTTVTKPQAVVRQDAQPVAGQQPKSPHVSSIVGAAASTSGAVPATTNPVEAADEWLRQKKW